MRTCNDCNMRKRPKSRTKAPLIPLPIPSAPWERVSVDIVGPWTTTYRGNKYVLCFTDHLTRFPECHAIPDCKATTIARIFFDNIICRYSSPRELLSDRGTAFLGTIVTETCKMFGIKPLHTTAYNPRCNGLEE